MMLSELKNKRPQEQEFPTHLQLIIMIGSIVKSKYEEYLQEQTIVSGYDKFAKKRDADTNMSLPKNGKIVAHRKT